MGHYMLQCIDRIGLLWPIERQNNYPVRHFATQCTKRSMKLPHLKKCP